MNDVRICEMAPRDGLQSLDSQKPVPIETKIALIDAIASAGVDFIEVGSFVSPRAVPQMADTLEMCQQLNKTDGVEYAALVPNLKHYDRFKQAGIGTVALFVSASEAYAKFNLRMSIAESMAAARAVAEAASRDGFGLRAHLSAVFHDTDGSDSDLKIVADLTNQLLDMGCSHVAWADTRGTAHPLRVRQLLGVVAASVDLSRIAVHFHDSYGMGIANALTAYQHGVRIFDCSVGGIGGTPFKDLANGPGGGGNIATEELVYMLNSMGVSTGVDFDVLLSAAHIVRDITATTGDLSPPSKMLR
jgi:hydroxymethylglutaryl-CoA lyase